MKTKNPVVSLSEFKAKAAQMLERMNASGQEIILTQNGSATAVVQDYESYQGIQEALAMMKLMVLAEADIKSGRLTPQAQIFSDLRKRVAPGRKDAEGIADTMSM